MLLRVRHHYLIFVFSLISLLLLTLFNQLEIIVFGAIAKTGNQFGSFQREKISVIVDFMKSIVGVKSDSFYAISFLFLCVGLSKAIFMFTNRYLTKILAVRICRDLRNQSYAHMQTLSLRFFSKYDRGNLSTRVITDANQIALSFNAFVENYIHLPFTVLSTLGVCLMLSWQLTCVLLVLIPCVALPLKFITKKIRSISYKMQKKQESFASVIIDHLSGIFTVKSYQLEKYSINKYSEENAKMTAYDEKIQKYDMMSRPITHFMMTVMLVSILYIGIHILGLSFPDLVVYCGVVHMLYSPFKAFSDKNADVQKGVVSANRLFDIMKEEPEERESKVDLAGFNQRISVEDLSFTYHDEMVLRKVNFEVDKGEVLAICGSTGSGKSTMLKLFSGLYRDYSGKILIDGINVHDISLKSLRQQFSVVAQEPFFFNDTIRANLIFDQNISEDQMIEACQKACIHDFVMTLEDGYDTIIEEMGKNLSGGQKQRLSIARALIRGSSIFLLDEATSSLDTVSEKVISDALEQMKGEITQVIVAHRLSTIQHADKILFLERGEVKAFGSLSHVLETAPGFAAMWEASQLEAAENI